MASRTRSLLGGLLRRGLSRSRRLPTGHEAGAAGVDELGREQITGWVLVPPETAESRIALCLGDVVATEVVAQPAGEAGDGLQRRRFRFALYDFWRFAKTSDTVSVRYAGRPILITDRQSYGYRPKTDGLSSAAELSTLLAAGHIFGQGGKIQLGKIIDHGWQDQVLRLHQAVHRVLADEFGLRTFLAYGTLLGAVRDHGFIDHDRDFDSAYLARHSDPREAAAELVRVAETLIDAGFQVLPKSSCIAIRDAGSGDAQIDLFHLIARPDGTVGFPFGTVAADPIGVAAFEPLAATTLAGREVLVPADAEAVVAHLYGTGWRVPDPGFSWLTARKRRESRALVGLDLQDWLYWRDFYARARPLPPSPFLSWVLDHPDLPGRAVDLGCGDGRDTAGLTAGGRTVIGIDRIPAALTIARDRVTGVDFREVDLADRGAVSAVLDQARGEAGEPLLSYARFLVHTLPEPGWLALLDLLAEHGRAGDVLAAELRIDADQKRPKAHLRSFRRFPPPAEVIGQLGDRGWTITDQQQGTGLSPYRSEDPALLRLLARR
ncbi:class I SAM-dependent methyltransferase [Microlunatus speluncae]|uniref:class I SAM-dependent methyltransferase n=1 Tax=Microlunatus speluncae TaxID=2594267 RepID=UPI001266890F|nr:LicD family protein [Microlunatus speluncae]